MVKRLNRFTVAAAFLAVQLPAFSADSETEYTEQTLPYWMEQLTSSNSKTMLQRVQATVAVTKIGKPAVPRLIDALRSEDADIREVCVQVLGKIGNDAHSAAQALLGIVNSDRSPDVRASAINAVVDITGGSLEIAELLISCLNDNSPSVINAAIVALGKSSKYAEKAVRPLTKRISKAGLGTDPETLLILNTLRCIGRAAKESLPEVEALLRHKNSTIRLSAVSAVIGISETFSDAERLLTPLLADSDPNVRNSVAQSLSELKKAP